MKISYLTTSTEVLFLAGLLASVGQGGNWQEFAVWPTSDEQEAPDIWGDIIVWQDNRNGNSEIYAVVLDGPEVAQCTSRIAGDVNGDCKIDFEDFAIMASNWLECYLEPAEACW